MTAARPEDGAAGAEDTPRPLLVGNDFPPDVGGIQRYIAALAERLPGVAVVAGGHPQAEALPFDFPVHRGRRAWLWPTAATRRLVAAAARTHTADVIVVTAPFPLVPAATGHGIPYTVVCHGAELIWPAAVPGVAAVYRRWLRGAACLFAVSRYTAAHVRALVGPDGPPIRLVRPGVDLQRYRPLDRDARTRVRQRHGWGNEPVVVSIGRLVPRKGTDRLLHALPAVRAAVPGTRLVIMGDGRSRRPLERLAARVAPAGAVSFLGRVHEPDVAAVLAAADVAAMPVRRRWWGLEQEGFGIVFVEAQSCGVPVVVGRSGGAPETTLDGRTGIVVDADDAAAVAGALTAMLADPERRVAMGRAARSHAEGFSWDATAERLRRDLAAVAAGRRPAADV